MTDVTNPNYEIILYWSEEDQAILAEIPELPGCMAHGTNYHDALANAEAAIEAWMATATELGRDVPKPKGRLIYA